MRLNFEQNTQEITQESTTEDIQYIWQETLVHLKAEMSPRNFEVWLASTVPVSFDGDTFVVSAKTKFAADHVNETLPSMVERILTNIVGRQVKFKCQAEGSAAG